MRYILLSLLCCLYSVTFAYADHDHHSGQGQPSPVEEHLHAEKSIFLGADFSPAITEHGMSVFGIHLELELPQAGTDGSFVIGAGADAIFSSAHGEAPENPVVPGISVAYMKHLTNIEIGGGAAMHLGIPGIETTCIIGKELSPRLHGHVGFGITLGRNSDGDSDILIGPLILGLGYRIY